MASTQYNAHVFAAAQEYGYVTTHTSQDPLSVALCVAAPIYL